MQQDMEGTIMAIENPVHTLTHEHVYILKVVDALSVIGSDIEKGKVVEPELFPRIVQFMREFADKCHHAKEEAVLFPLMEEKGVPKTGCPLSALRAEHVKGRVLVGRLEQAAASPFTDSAEARAEICTVIKEIAHLYHDHIWKEDAMVFPMTDNMFSEEEFASMADAFEKAESEYGQNHAHYVAFANEMASRSGA
jgi:hemerythrin-like domain-containing protein